MQAVQADYNYPAFDDYVFRFQYYNCNNELGYYPAFYVKDAKNNNYDDYAITRINSVSHEERQAVASFYYD